MPATIVISDAALFAAAVLFMSSEQTRPYLHGVYVEPAEGGGVLLTATDGIKLFHAWNKDGVANAPAIIKPEKPALPPAWSKPGASLWIDLDAKTMACGNGKNRLGIMGAERFDGTFPDHRRVVPQTFSGEVAQFSLAQLATFHKAAKLLGGHSDNVDIGHNGTGPALVRFGVRDDCYGILMSLRPAGGDISTLPELPRAAVAAPATAES